MLRFSPFIIWLCMYCTILSPVHLPFWTPTPLLILFPVLPIMIYCLVHLSLCPFLVTYTNSILSSLHHCLTPPLQTDIFSTFLACQVFKVDRDGEYARYKPFKELHNRQLLWHGSSTTNYAGILSQGLRIAPPEAPVVSHSWSCNYSLIIMLI